MNLIKCLLLIFSLLLGHLTLHAKVPSVHWEEHHNRQVIPADTLGTILNDWTEHTLKLSEHLFYMGQLDRALELVQTGINLFSEGNSDQLNLARMLIKKGKLLAFQSFTTNSGYSEGLRALEEAKGLLSGTGRRRQIAEAHLYTGFLIYSRRYNAGEGSYEMALNEYQRAQKIRREIGDKRGIAEVLYYEGIIYERLDSLDKAESLYRQSFEIASKYQYDLEKSYATRHLAFLRLDEKNYDLALKLFKESLELRQKVGFHIYLPFSYLSVGQVYEEMSEVDKALPYYRNALEKAEEIGARRVMVLCLLSIGSARSQLNDIDGAREAFTRAASISSEINYESGIKRAGDGLKSLEKQDK